MKLWYFGLIVSKFKSIIVVMPVSRILWLAKFAQGCGLCSMSRVPMDHMLFSWPENHDFKSIAALLFTLFSPQYKPWKAHALWLSGTPCLSMHYIHIESSNTATMYFYLCISDQSNICKWIRNVWGILPEHQKFPSLRGHYPTYVHVIRGFLVLMK